MRFDSSTLNSIGDIPLGEISTPWRFWESPSVTHHPKVFLDAGDETVMAEAKGEQSKPQGKVAVAYTQNLKIGSSCCLQIIRLVTVPNSQSYE